MSLGSSSRLLIKKWVILQLGLFIRIKLTNTMIQNGVNIIMKKVNLNASLISGGDNFYFGNRQSLGMSSFLFSLFLFRVLKKQLCDRIVLVLVGIVEAGLSS